MVSWMKNRRTSVKHDEAVWGPSDPINRSRRVNRRAAAALAALFLVLAGVVIVASLVHHSRPVHRALPRVSTVVNRTPPSTPVHHPSPVGSAIPPSVAQVERLPGGVISPAEIVPGTATMSVLLPPTVANAWAFVTRLPDPRWLLSTTKYTPGASILAVGYAAVPSSVPGQFDNKVHYPTMDLVYLEGTSHQAALDAAAQLLASSPAGHPYRVTVTDTIVRLTPSWAPAGGGDATLKQNGYYRDDWHQGELWMDPVSYIEQFGAELSTRDTYSFDEYAGYLLGAERGVYWTGHPSHDAYHWQGTYTGDPLSFISKSRALLSASQAQPKRVVAPGSLISLLIPTIRLSANSPTGSTTSMTYNPLQRLVTGVSQPYLLSTLTLSLMQGNRLSLVFAPS